jgi:N-acetylglucosaminyl-diphospho-decaprenol L-rhamnosyltransferase
VSTDAVRAVVLTYGTGAEHEPLLDSLAREGLDAGRVLLVHNPSAPGERLPPPPAGYEVVEANHNLGYAAGMNLGIERQLARGCDLLLILTHDARLRDGALEAMVRVARGRPDYGVLGPALVLSGAETPFSFGGVTHADGGVSHRKSAPAAPDGVAPCDWLDGGTMLARAEALERTGGFDERFWAYFEDADLCLRMTRSGFKVGVVLDALADQAPGAAKRPGPWAYLLTRNGAAYAQRFAGARGVAVAAIRAVLLALFELLRIAVRTTPLRDGSRAAPWAVAVGRVRGMADFFRRRWGPPPPGLPGGGDLRNVEPSPAEAGDGR